MPRWLPTGEEVLKATPPPDRTGWSNAWRWKTGWTYRWGLNPSRDRKEETVASKIRFSLQNADLYSFWFEHGNDQKRGEL